MPAAHTDADLYVHAPELNLLAAGGVVSGGGVAAARLAQRRVAGRPRPRARAPRGPRQARHPRRPRRWPRDDRPRDRAHRDMYQKLFTTMIGYLNMGLGSRGRGATKPAQGIPSPSSRRSHGLHLRRDEEHGNRVYVPDLGALSPRPRRPFGTAPVPASGEPAYLITGMTGVTANGTFSRTDVSGTAGVRSSASFPLQGSTTSRAPSWSAATCSRLSGISWGAFCISSASRVCPLAAR